MSTSSRYKDSTEPKGFVATGALGAMAKDRWEWKDEHLSVLTLSRDNSNACVYTVSQGSPGCLSLFATVLSVGTFLVSLS